MFAVNETEVFTHRNPHGLPTTQTKRLKFFWGVAKRREGLKKQHSVLFFPERDRAAARSFSKKPHVVIPITFNTKTI